MAAADAMRRSGEPAHGAMRPDFEHAAGGLVILLTVTVRSVYKPPGLTPYGWRRQAEARRRR